MSAIYVEYGEVAAVEGVVRGLGAAVIALVVAAVIRVGGRVIHTPVALGLAVVAFALLVASVPFPLISSPSRPWLAIWRGAGRGCSGRPRNTRRRLRQTDHRWRRVFGAAS